VPSTTAESVSQRVMIAVDPHNASWTAAAVDESLRAVGTIRVPVSRVAYRQLRRFACRGRSGRTLDSR